MAAECVSGPPPLMLTPGMLTPASDVLSSFNINDMDDDIDPSYYGFTDVNGRWCVKRVTDVKLDYATVSNNPTRVTYSDAWTNRATLVYSRYDEAF